MNPIDSPRQVAGYRVVSHLGTGGMGEVYLAIDTTLEREVALKTLRPEMGARPELVERFRIEAIALARLHHRHIAQVYACFEANGAQHIAMQYVRGQTLEAELTQRGRLPWRDAAAVALDVLQALDHAHALGVVHRDLKPANLMRDQAGRTVVMDFGIARVMARERQTRAGTLVGTLEYIAPEIVRGQAADARSDLYALGVVVFELLAGRLPFQADSDFELMRAHAEQAPPRPVLRAGAVPPALEAWVLRLLEKNPARRPASAAAAAEMLTAALQVASRTTDAAVPAMASRLRTAASALRRGFDLPGSTADWPVWRAWLRGNPGLTGAALVALAALGAVGGQGARQLCCSQAPVGVEPHAAAPSVKPAPSLPVLAVAGPAVAPAPAQPEARPHAPSPAPWVTPVAAPTPAPVTVSVPAPIAAPRASLPQAAAVATPPAVARTSSINHPTPPAESGWYVKR